jgi:hypothetical protein
VDKTEEQNNEHIPECVEVKLAYDLSVIPVAGVLFYVILEIMVNRKLGSAVATKSYWLRKGLKRILLYTGCPVVFGLLAYGFCYTPDPQEATRTQNSWRAQYLMRDIVNAQNDYFRANERYAPTLATLTNGGYMYRYGFDACTAPGVNSAETYGYLFQMTAGQTWSNTKYYVRCRPISEETGNRFFSADASGQVVEIDPYN